MLSEFFLYQVPRDRLLELAQVVRNTFTGQNTEQFLIRVLQSETDKAQALHLIKEELLRDHPIARALKFDPVSESSLEVWLKVHLDQNITYGCFTHEGNQLVAVDALYVRNIRDIFPDLKEMGEPFMNFIKYVRVIERRIRYPLAEKKCNYLTSFGVFTTPAYRDIGIPIEMIRIRSWIAKTILVEVMGYAFIGHEMHEAANTYRYKKLETLNGPEEMKKVELDFDFGTNIFPIKIMGLEFRF